jgi:hypothetical protein
MKPHLLALPFLLANLCLPAWAGESEFVATAAARPQAGPMLVAQQVASGEDLRRDETAFGRRLSPSELAELRQQVREQWASAPEAARSAELPATGRNMSGPAPKDASSPVPRGQHP